MQEVAPSGTKVRNEVSLKVSLDWNLLELNSGLTAKSVEILRFTPPGCWRLGFRLAFSYHSYMFPTASGRKTFVVTCKHCRRDVPSGLREFPFQSVAVECPLCGELRRYLPSEVILGRPDGLVTRQRRTGSR